jgi:hypothetical protein
MSNKTTQQESPFDFITENKSLTYNISILESDIRDLRARNTMLQDLYKKLQIEHENLQSNYKIMYSDMKTVKDITIELEQTKNKIIRLEFEMKEKEKEYEKEKENLIKNYESEIIRLRQLLDINSKKVDSYNQLQHICDKQDEQIKFLNREMEKIKAEAEQRVERNMIKHEMKFATIKKKMVDTVNEMQNNVSQLNIETMDTSSKLTLLQNHQLLIDLEFQSQEVEELLAQKQALEKKILELQYDLDVSMEVQKKIVEKYNKLKKEITKLQSAEIQVAKSAVISINDKSNTISENKIKKLESQLKKKEKEAKHLQEKLNLMIDSQTFTDKRNYGLYKLFEDGFNYLIEYEGLKNASEVFLDIESIKRADFISMSLKEKYSVLVILINFILKNIRPEYLSLLDDSKEIENPLSEANADYLINKKIIPYWKKINPKDIPMMNPVRRNVEGLPIITNYRYKL